jgi:hypothetical protein
MEEEAEVADLQEALATQRRVNIHLNTEVEDPPSTASSRPVGARGHTGHTVCTTPAAQHAHDHPCMRARGSSR